MHRLFARPKTYGIVWLVGFLLGQPLQVCAADPYTRVSERLETLKSGSLPLVTRLGDSHSGRPLYAVVFPAKAGPPESNLDWPRILVISGQHGNEQTPVYAMLDLIEELAGHLNDNGFDVLGKVAIAFVPVVNPDGFAAAQRANRAGVDLNRNWSSPNQPETEAVLGLIEQLQPDVIMDLHEWADDDPHKPDCVEVAGFGDSPQNRLARFLAGVVWSATRGETPSFGTVHYTRELDNRLAHRWFTDKGMCGMLVETSPALPADVRKAAYKRVVLAVVESLAATNEPKVLDALIAMRSKSAGESHWPVTLSMVRARASTPQSQTTLWVILTLLSVYFAGRFACRNNTGLIAEAQCRRRKPSRDRNLSMTEAVQCELPFRARLTLLQTLRTRPSDRPQ